MDRYFALQQYSSKFLERQSKIEIRLSFYRLLVAITFVVLSYSSIKSNFSLYLLLPTCAFFLLFLFLVRKHQLTIEQLKFYKALNQVCQNEINSEHGDNSQFLSGSEYIETNHPFSFDLDLFGKGSVFQSLNRAFTKYGRDTLAQWLMYPVISKDEIIARQKIVRELQDKSDWILEFLAKGSLIDEKSSELEKCVQWLQEKNDEFNPKFKFLIWIIPIWGLAIIFATIFGKISPILWLILITLQTNVLTLFSRKIHKRTLLLSTNAVEISKYALIFEHIERQTFDNHQLKDELSFLRKKGGMSSNIKVLGKIDRLFLLRKTFFGSMFINVFFPLDLYCIYRYDTWKKENGQSFLHSLKILHKWEALISITNYSIIHKNYIFPEVSENNILRATQLGHPLLPKDKSIKNDIVINPSFFIITGANMAGKSTFLRAIGVNLILAMIGCPVCAEKFIFKPTPIFTCMRIDDSINEGKSYFHAELTRLKEIVELLERNEHVFIILDELLKGTNSMDKLKGSELFLEKLMNYDKCHGLIATPVSRSVL